MAVKLFGWPKSATSEEYVHKISKNYSIFEKNLKIKALFPRSTMVVGYNRKNKNSSEILSPTVQPSKSKYNSTEGHNGTFHCSRFNKTNKCDICSDTWNPFTLFTQKMVCLSHRRCSMWTAVLWINNWSCSKVGKR